ncbi:MAG: TolC family protein [Nitrosomonadales bacterium]|nr:TolC family protein [Nitrosomonadales bacterium]
MGKRLKILFVFWLAASPAQGGEPAPLPGSNVEDLLELARQHNPELAAARLEAEAAAERIRPAGALPDPVLRVELMDITNSGTDKAASLLPSQVGSTRYTAMQPVPFWGKRDLKRSVAQAEAEQARSRSGAAWAELSARVKTGFAQYYRAARSREVTQEILDLANDLERIAMSRYSSGLASQQDVIRAQIEQTALRRELVMLDTERHQAMARLNAQTGRAPDAPLADPQRLRPIPAKLEPSALESRMRARNPQLFALDAQVAAAEKGRELALRNRYPDFILGLSPVQSGWQIKEWGLMVEMNIPLQQQSRRAQERETETMLAAAHARKEGAVNQLLSELAENALSLDAARQIETLAAASLLPQAEASFQAALAGYQNGKVDFATLLDAQRQIFKTRLEVLTAQADAQIRLAEIERLLGEDL